MSRFAVVAMSEIKSTSAFYINASRLLKALLSASLPATRGYAGSCRDEDDATQIKKGQEQSERAAAAFVHGVLGDSFLSCPIISQTRTLGCN